MFGKAFRRQDLLVNLKALQETIDRNRPSSLLADYACLTMGPSIQLDINALRDLKFTDAA